MKDNSNPKKKITSKQIVAMAGVILLVALYIVTFIVAIINPGESGNYFQICLVSTIVVPILIWIYVWMYGKLTNRRTFADPDYIIADEPKEN
jgi:amino acid transporter